MLLRRGTLLLAAAGLLFLASSASAQRLGIQYRPSIYGGPINANPVIAPGLTLQQAAYNMTVLGNAARRIPPYLYGYNPYPSPIITGAPTVGYPIAGNPYVASPYSLATSGGMNPYGSGYGSAALDNSPYGLSTVGSSPYGSGLGGYGGYGGYGAPIYGESGGTLIGASALVNAAGQYHMNVQQARLYREQARQMSYETTRRRIELERWYESTRPTPQQLRDRETAAELEKTRKDAPEGEINSGKALNILLASVQKSASQLNRGPNVPLREEVTLKINVAPSNSTANVGMLKEIDKLTWPEGLQDGDTEAVRKRLIRKLRDAVATLKDGEAVSESTRKDIREDYKTLNNRLNDAPDELNSQQYIEARRFLNQLQQAVRALSEPNAGKYFSPAWSAKGKNVAELIAHMTQEGLTFAQAAPGDQPAYKALYLALRQFEAGLETAQR